MAHNRFNSSANAATGSLLHRAFIQLETSLKDLPSNMYYSSLLVSGYGVYREVHYLANKKKSDIPEEKLIDILRTSARLIAGNQAHSDGDVGYREEIERYYQLSKDVRHFPWGYVLAATITALIGTAIVVASGVIAAVSFGFLAPISLLVITLGISMIIGGVASGVATIGTGAVMGSGLLFFKAAEKNVLRQEMKELMVSAKGHYGF